MDCGSIAMRSSWQNISNSFVAYAGTADTRVYLDSGEDPRGLAILSSFSAVGLI